MGDWLKWHVYLTVNQIANVGCYLLEACIEDKKYLVALENGKTPLLSGTLCQYEESEMAIGKDEQYVDVAMHNNITSCKA